MTKVLTENHKPINDSKVYISGQITGLDEEYVIGRFAKAETFLQTKGYKEIVNPITITHDHDRTWISFMVEDIRALFGCDVVYMLSNWKKSKGARIEHYIAVEIGIEIVYEE